MIRIDRDHIRYLPEDVARAAEVLVAYVTGLDQGIRLPREEAPTVREVHLKDVAPPAEPAGADARAVAESHIKDREAAAKQAVEEADGDDDIGICLPLRPRDRTRERSSVPLEVVVLWGRGFHAAMREQ